MLAVLFALFVFAISADRQSASAAADRKCFDSQDELKDAVRQYIKDDGEGTPVAETYGWPINDWCVSHVTTMLGLFTGFASFNGDISSWDISSVTNMYTMFGSATSFNGDISSWDVSSVTNMIYMFNDATSFNGDVSSWDVSSVTDMSRMFSGATSFNQNLCSWNEMVQDASVRGIFKDSNCPSQHDPSLLDDGGPFCASTCIVNDEL